MTSEIRIIAADMATAMTQVKEKLGPDAVIVAVEDNAQGVVITAAASPDAAFDETLPFSHVSAVRSAMTKPTGASITFDDPMKAIRVVCDLCEFHQTGYEFCEKWLKQLSSDFVLKPFGLARALGLSVQFDQTWLEQLTPRTPIVLVGPQGGGKTVVLAKLAALLLSRQKTLTVLTLDTIKASGAQQLEFYMKALNQSILIGERNLEPSIISARTGHNRTLTLIDTPGVNISREEDRKFIKELSSMVGSPLTLVLPADINPVDAMDLAASYKPLNVRNMIMTRFDTTRHYGGILSAAAMHHMALTFYSDSPSIRDNLKVCTSDLILENMIRANEGVVAA